MAFGDWTERDRRRRAYHEAGHAVVAAHFGRRFDSVSILDDLDSAGHVLHSGPMLTEESVRALNARQVSPDALQDIEQACVILLAGEESQLRVSLGSERRRRFEAEADSAADRRELQELLMHLHREESRAIRHRTELHARTVALLNDPLTWKAIEAVANALLARDTLTGQKVLTIIEEVRSA